jgi:hypothetical protein
LLICGHVLPPALVVLLADRLALGGWSRFAVYVAGAVVSLACYSWLTASLGLRGRKQLRAAFTRKFEQEGIALSGSNAMLMGFSPSATPRFYLSSYNWDTGFLVFLRDRVVFLGDKVRFALKPEQIISVRMGPAGPGWWSSGRVYVDWRDSEKGREGTFNLLPHEPTSVTRVKGEANAFLQRLQAWQRNPASYPEAQSSMLALDSPMLGEVTSQSPKQILAGPRANAISVMIMLVGYGFATLLGISPWYIFGLILLLRVYERIPYWRYREMPAWTMQPSPSAARAQASGLR